MDDTVAIQSIRAALPAFPVESVQFEGEGDFCRAYTVNGDWIVRFACNEEGSRSLYREASLLPALAPTLNLPIPGIAHFGLQDNGLAFVAYPRIPGNPLTREHLLALPAREQERCSRDLAAFLTALHSFDVETARQLGVISAPYPFSRTEEGIMQGSARDIYLRELSRLTGYPILDRDTRLYCTGIVEQILSAPSEAALPPALVHGDLSHDHVLFDPKTNRITGIIDFSDVIVTSPLLDFMYLQRSYGDAFLHQLMAHYAPDHPLDLDRPQVTAQIYLLRQWHAALRLLWTLDHNYQPGIQPRLEELLALKNRQIFL